MDNFSVVVYLRIITASDDNDGSILVLLDNSGEIPSFELSNKSSLDSQILKNLSELLYQNDIDIIYTTRTISEISQSSEENNKIKIFYNFIAINTYSKTGAFVSYNKNSIELHKLSIGNI